MAEVVERLDALPGARHVSLTDTGRAGAFHESGAGGLRPVAMERALAQIGQERAFAR